MVFAFALTVVLSLVITALYGRALKDMTAVDAPMKYGFVAVLSGVTGLLVGTFAPDGFPHFNLACAAMGVLASLVTMRRVMSR